MANFIWFMRARQELTNFRIYVSRISSIITIVSYYSDNVDKIKKLKFIMKKKKK